MQSRTKERWKPIRQVRGKLISDLYEVSTKGRVRRRLPRGGFAYVAGHLIPAGYVQFGFRRLCDGKATSILGHDLVWDAWGRGSRNRHHVHHIDHDQTNNSIANLEILTPAAHRRHHAKRLSWRSVRAIRRKRARGVSVARLAAHYQVCERTIYLVIKHQSWTDPAYMAG